MPGWPSPSEHRALDSFPEQIGPEDLDEHFKLSPADLRFAFRHRRDGRLGVAVQLCALRWLGFVPEELTAIPQPALLELCDQLEANAADLDTYGARGQTRTDQLAAARAHAGFRPWDAPEASALEAWLTVRAMEHERPKALFTLAAEQLHVQRIARPSVDQLVRLIGAARERAHQATFDALADQLTDRAIRARLDRLLERRADGTTWIEWLRTPAPDASPRYILQQLGKFTYLKELGADAIDLSMLPPGRVRMLAGDGRRRPAWELARLAASRRLAVLLAFCAQTLVERGDELIDLYAAGVQNAERHARFAVAKQREQTARARDDHALLGQTLARILVDALENGEDPVSRVLAEVGETRLRAAAQDPGSLTRRVEDQRRDALWARHAHLAQFAPRVLAGLDLKAAPGDQPLLDAIRYVEVNRDRQFLPDTPLDVLSATYRAWVVDEHGRVVRTRYELALWLVARDALRARRLYRTGSHRYGDPAAWMMPRAQWEAERVELAAVFDRPLDGRVRLEQLQGDQERLVRALQHGHETGVDVLYDGEKIVGRRPGAQPVPVSARQLVTSTHAMLPKVGIAALIIDVARDVPFMDELRHAGGQQARSPTRRGQLFAALVACATGMGYTRMAEASKFTERQLREAAERHCTIEHLAAADALVCEAIRGLAQSSTLDLERISSSDGQRYPIIGRSALAGFAAREAGYRRRMVTWMIWINEQYAHFGSKVISVTEREGLHTLDAIVLADDAPEIHTADTHGATELVFAGFDLLGRRFIPRLSDIAEVPLYGLGPGQPQLAADMLLARKVRDEVIVGQWEELLRLAGSIKRGWIVPSILLTRMHADPRPDRLAKALREYGRLVRTNFILDWVGDPALRGRGLGQLNKGESANALHRYVGFGNRGRVYARDPEQLQRHMDCRRLISNVIVYWNTRYIAHALETLERQGHTLRDDDIRHIHPVHFEHINPFGHYRFDTQRGPAKGRLRPLRPATYTPRVTAATNATATNA